MRPFAQAAGGGAARTMAGDSEQTLQNHQQPNGGEPFLIGVSGGTASGKVRRGPKPRSPPGSGPGGACGRRPRAMSVAAATAWPARLRSRPRSSAECAPRGLGALRRGRAKTRAKKVLGVRGYDRRAGVLPSLFSPCVNNSWPGSYGGKGREADAYCFVSPALGGEGFPQDPLRTADGPPHPPTPAPVWHRRARPAAQPGAEGGASREARPGGRGWRERARRHPGEGEPRLGLHSRAGDYRGFRVKA